MALLNINFFSEILKRDVDIKVCVPSATDDILQIKGKIDYYNQKKKYPSLILLHGAYGDYSNWCRHSKIENYAQERGIVVIMPSLGNSFGFNLKSGDRYEDFICRELIQFCRFMLPISRERKDSSIGGLSMGGYAGFRYALKYPEIFGQAISLSGGLDIKKLRYDEDILKVHPFIWEDIFDESMGDVDLIDLLEINKENAPRLYMTCGKNDFVYGINCEMYDKLKEAGADIMYMKEEGNHNWGFWDSHIDTALAWMKEKRTKEN